MIRKKLKDSKIGQSEVVATAKLSCVLRGDFGRCPVTAGVEYILPERYLKALGGVFDVKAAAKPKKEEKTDGTSTDTR